MVLAKRHGRLSSQDIAKNAPSFRTGRGEDIRCTDSGGVTGLQKPKNLLFEQSRVTVRAKHLASSFV